LFDLDRFKALNEVAGQLAGDEVLRSVGSALAKQCRRGDSAYRHGGEEMLVAFPSQSLETTTIAAERMREAIESLAIPHPGLEPPGVVTVSVGVACLQPQSGDEVDMLLERAELGLQAAKDAGRNRVVARERAAHRA
jgi:two-component system cell cycle response regulator